MANKNSRTKNSILNIATSLGGQVVVTLMEFVCRTIFIKTLGAEYLGINGLFTNILTLLSLSELGIDTAMNFKLYKPLKENDQSRIRVLMKFYKYAYRIVGLIILFLGLCLIPLLPLLVKDYERFAELGLNAGFIFILFLLKTVTSYLFFASRSAILKADQKSYITTTVTTVSTIVLNIIQIITLLIFKNFILYTVLAIAAGIMANYINAMIARRQYHYAFEKTKDSISKEELRDIFKDLGALFLFKANGVINKAIDNIVLSSFIGLAMVGLYSNYLIFYTTIRGILTKIYSSIRASLGNLYVEDNPEKKYQFFEIFDYLTYLLYGTAAVGVAVIGNELITCWLGKEYIVAQPLAILIGIEIVFLGITQSLGQIRVVSGAFRQMWTRPIFSILINIVVSIVGVHICGIYGVLIGTIMSSALTNFIADPKVIYQVNFKGYRSLSDYYLRNFKYMGTLLVVGIIDFFICRYFLNGWGWFSVVIHIIIVAITVPGTYILVFRKRHETQYAINFAKRMLNKIMRKETHK